VSCGRAIRRNWRTQPTSSIAISECDRDSYIGKTLLEVSR
jgi:hypothetical protein